MRVVNRGRHQLGCFIAGIAKHQTLVAGAGIEVVIRRMVYALGNVVGLFVVSDENRAAFVINTVFGVVVADAFDRVPRDLDVVHVGVGGDLAR